MTARTIMIQEMALTTAVGTWSVQTAELVDGDAELLQAIAGPDPKDPTSSRAPVPDYSAALKEDIKGLTIGVPRHFFWADDPSIDRETLAVVDAALQTLAELGAQVEEVTIPTLHYAGAAQPAIMLSEAFAYHQRLLRSQPEEFGDMVRARFRIGGLLSSADYVQAQRVRNVLTIASGVPLERGRQPEAPPVWIEVDDAIVRA